MQSFIEAKKASKILKNLTNEQKNNAIKIASQAILDNADEILKANALDVKEQTEKGATSAFIDRLTLNNDRISKIASDMVSVSLLEDPTNKVVEETIAKSGIKIKKVTVPFGVVGVIYESRPNVTADVFTLLLKSGNACVLKGGSEAKRSNEKIVEVLRQALTKTDVPKDAVVLLPSTREWAEKLIKAKGYVDLIFPRGSKNLINYVTLNATVPVIETGAGVCHTYVSKNAEIEEALKILKNAKVSRPSVCNACETLLVDSEIAKEFINKAKEIMPNVNFHGSKEENAILKMSELPENGYYTEYNSYDLSIKIVNGVKDAVEHINEYGTHHSDCICSKDETEIDYFLKNVDSACVYANASTRFSDGGCFGMGAEIGISTQKLHARGPMGLKELTTYQYIIIGNGEIRE